MSIEKPKTLREQPVSKEVDSLGKPESEKTKNIDQEKIPTILDSSPSYEADENNEKNFPARLVDLKKAMEEMKEHGEEITEEMFENIMDMKFSEFEGYVNSGKIITQEDLRSFHKKVSDILNKNYDEITKESNYQGSKTKQFIRSAGFKASFGVAMFLAKFNPLAANEHKAVVKDKVIAGTEVTAQPDLGGGDSGMKKMNAKDTFKFSPEAVTANELRDASKIDITQLFKIDKAEISADDAKDIKNQIDSFLDKIDSHNFEKFEQAKKIADVSSSEEPTKYGAEDKKLAPTLENNKELTGDRFLKGAGIAEAAFKNHDYSKSDLSLEQIEIAKNTKIQLKAPEKGYTKVSELKDQNGEVIGEKAVEEMKKNNPELYKKLNAECRHFKLDLMVESALQKINQHDRFTFFVDNTNSTEYTMESMANKIEKIGTGENSKGNITKVDLVYYSDDINSIKHLSDITKVADDLRGPHIKGGSLEKPFKISIDYYKDLIKNDSERIKNGEVIEDDRGAAWTLDEGLQEAQNIFEAAKLAQKAHVKNATLFLFSRDSLEPLEKDAFEVKDKIGEIIKAKMELNLSTLKQTKQNQEKNLNELISEANDKVSPKTLNELFGQDKLPGGEETIKMLIAENGQESHQLKNIKSSPEKNILNQLFKSASNFEKADKLLSAAESKTFEDYLKTTKLEVKVFTDDKGKEVSFDVFGYEDTPAGSTFQSIKL